MKSWASGGTSDISVRRQAGFTLSSNWTGDSMRINAISFTLVRALYSGWRIISYGQLTAMTKIDFTFHSRNSFPLLTSHTATFRSTASTSSSSVCSVTYNWMKVNCCFCTFNELHFTLPRRMSVGRRLVVMQCAADKTHESDINEPPQSKSMSFVSSLR